MSDDLTMDEMLKQIVAKLYARPEVKRVSSDTVVPSNANDQGYAISAVRAGDAALVKTYLRFASDNTNSFFAINATYEALADCGVKNPGQYLTPQTVHTYISTWNNLMDIAARRPEVDTAGILCFSVMSGDEDCQIIERLVDEREPATVDEVKALLTEVKSCASGLSSGVL